MIYKNKTLKETPEYIIEILQSKAIPKTSILASICADISNKGEAIEVWLIAQNEGLIMLSGTSVPITRNNYIKRNIPPEICWKEKAYTFYPFTELKEFKLEKLLSCASLIGKLFDNDYELCRFASGSGRLVDMFVKALNKLSKGEELNDSDYELDKNLFCPKCGMQYVDEKRKVCPNCLNKGSSFFRMLGLCKNYMLPVSGILLIALATVGVNVIAPLVGGRVFYNDVLALGGKWYGQMGMFIILLMSVRFISVLLGTLNGVLIGRTSAKMIYDFRNTVFSKVQSLSLSFFNSRQTGSIMHQINNDAESIYWMYVDGLPYFIINCLTLGITICIMVGMNWTLTLLTFITIPIPFFGMFFLRKFMHKMFVRRWWSDNNLSKQINDNFIGKRVVKAFSKEKNEIERFTGASKKLKDAETTIGLYNGTVMPIITSFMTIGNLIVWGVGGWQIITGQIVSGNAMTLGDLMTFVAYLNMVYGPFSYFTWFLNTFMERMASVQRIFEVVDTVPEIQEIENPIHIENMKGSVRFDNVTFGYDKKIDILKEIDFSIDARKTIGIVGRTGAGKTTLVNLIMRLYDVKEGAIYIDDVNVKDIAFTDLRRNIGVVSQEIFLFNGTIAENIAYANPEATMEQIISAAKMANAHEFIQKLTDGYDTYVGATGINLSGGERQRISIARCILHNPRILILDEATASMDTITELKIQQSLNNLKAERTTIIIAHRLSTLRDADYLVVIDDGKLTERGTHNELINLKGTYFKLYQIQSEALKTIGVGE